MDVVEWLLESDPAIRWQVMEDLTDEPEEAVAAERARVASEGWGAQLLALRGDDGQWAEGAYIPSGTAWESLERGEDGRLLGQPWTATAWSLTLLRIFGLDPDHPKAKETVALVKENSRWDHDGQPFFDGEVEPCINGVTVAIGSYFGEDVSGVVDRLLEEQMEDGGWNCEQENGSIRGSFHTTISVLEGFFEYRARFGESAAVTEASRRGEQYLLDRRMYRRLSTGEVADPSYVLFSFPNWWHYDVLRGLDYLRKAEVEPDERIQDAIGLLEDRRSQDGRWPRQHVHQGAVHFEVDAAEGEASRWNTLRAMRVLRWAGSRPD